MDVVPCRVLLWLAPNPWRELRLVFDDGDNPPLDAVDVRVYRRRDELLFPWPAGDVVLGVGHPQLGSAQYDLELLRDELVLRPTKPVTATLLAARMVDQPFDVRQPALLAALAVAALALLLVLRRSLAGEPTV